MQTADFNPLVSIIIPVYNGSNYVSEAIDSALAQTYKNIEIIVVNDGSNDNGKTEEIALSYGDKIRYFKKKNGGVSSALNLGIEKMEGEYFSWLSHDDKYEPQKIEKEIAVLSVLENKETVVLCSDRAIDKNSEIIPKHKEKVQFKNGDIISCNEAFKGLFNYGSYNGCALLIHKHVFETVGKFEEKFRYIQDLYMWANIFSNGFPLIYISDELVLSRIHAGQLTQTGRDLFYKESLAMAEKLLPKLMYLKQDCIEEIIFAYASYNAVYNNKKVVRLILNECNNKITSKNRLKIKLKTLYGMIRPMIRKIYYKLVLQVKTK